MLSGDPAATCSLCTRQQETGDTKIFDDTGLRATATGLVRLNAVIAALIS